MIYTHGDWLVVSWEQWVVAEGENIKAPANFAKQVAWVMLLAEILRLPIKPSGLDGNDFYFGAMSHVS